MAQTKINGRQLAVASLPVSALNKALPQQIIICDLIGTPTFATLTGDAIFTSNPSTNLLELVLTPSGVGSGVYGSATKAIALTVDSKGRLTEITSVLITPEFSSIVNLPTTLAGYGITDANSTLEFDRVLVPIATAIVELQLMEVNRLIYIEEQSQLDSPLLAIAASVIINQVMFIQRFAFT